MTRFVLKRLCWAIPVLFIASVLVFIAVRSSTDPVAALARNPRVNPQALEEYKHEPRTRPAPPDAVLDLVEDVRHVATGASRSRRAARCGLTSRGRSANTLMLGCVRVHHHDHGRRHRRHHLGAAPVLQVRQPHDRGVVHRPVDPAVLVRADPPAVLRGDAHEVVPPARAVLAGLGAVPTGSRGLRPVVAAQVHDPPGDRRRRAGHRDLQPLHAVVDARGDELRLHAHRAREGDLREAGDRAPRASATR